MPISFEQATVYLALAKQHAEGKDVAMAFEEDGRICGFGVADERSTYDSRSALINLLQHEKRRFTQIGYTRKPTERDLGMARMAKATSINYLDGEALKFTTRAGPGFEHAWADGASLFYNQATGIGLAAPAQKKPDKSNEWYAANIAPARPAQQPPQDPLHPLMAKVSQTFAGAKKYTHFVREHTDLDLPINLNKPDGLVRNDPNALRDEIFMYLAWAIVGEGIGARDDNGKYPTGHSIGSVLRGPKDDIIAFGLNTNKEHWTLHGEVNLLQTYQDDAAVVGVEIGKGNVDNKPIMYTTLEPCFMCAGMYYDAGQSLLCKYGQKDVGIEDSVLETHEHQSLLATSIGTLAAEALAPKIQGGRRYAITKFLNNDFKAELQKALDKYFDIVPDAPAAQAQPSAKRADWTAHRTLESHIWENGVRLLCHINDGVLVKWQARANKHYAITGIE